MLAVRSLALTIALAVAGAHAQSACATECATSDAAIRACPIYTDPTCVCTNTAWMVAYVVCLPFACSAEDRQAAEAFHAHLCAIAYPSSSFASSVVSPVFSSASSVEASASSTGASITSALSSALSSATSAASSHASSVSSSVSSAAGSPTGSPSAAHKVPVLGAAVWSVAVAAVGAVAGGLVVL